VLTQYYALYDLDGNDTKELLLGGYSRVGGIGIYTVSAVQNGVAVPLEPVLSWDDYDPPTVLFRNGIIRATSVNDELRFDYYRFEDGVLKYQARLIKGLDSTEGEYYRRDPDKQRVPLTKEEFDQVKAEMEGDGQVVELDWKQVPRIYF